MFDSFASGVPIIQNTKGWIYDLILKYECGLNVNSLNPITISDAIQKIADNDDYRNHLAENSKKLAQTLFNREYLSSQYELGLRNILSID